MALRPLKPCRHPGCPELTRTGWCDKHRPTHKRRVSAEYHSWYALPVWQKMRADHLLREPFCRACAMNGIRTAATVVDHIQPHRGDWQRFTDRTNLQSLCKYHHDQKTMQEQLADRREMTGT
ncbi:MAG: HNH endonuclease [Oscillospiraceae bacterium]|nr:HNH endonuclease [Oscillospiraceae bacterium]